MHGGDSTAQSLLMKRLGLRSNQPDEVQDFQGNLAIVLKNLENIPSRTCKEK